MDGFEEIQRLREEYESVLDEAEAQRTAYHQAIRKAYLAGASLGDIAAELGLSRQRVHEIVGKEPAVRRRKRKQILGSAGLLGLVAVAGFGAWFFISYERQAVLVPPQSQPCPLPCPGWRYHAAYRIAGGDIAAVVAQKERVPGNPLAGGAVAIAKARSEPEMRRVQVFSRVVMPHLPGEKPVPLPKGFQIQEITSDPRIRELMRGDLDDYYIANGHIQRSRRELALGIAWGIIGTVGLVAIIAWNLHARRKPVQRVTTVA